MVTSTTPPPGLTSSIRTGRAVSPPPAPTVGSGPDDAGAVAATARLWDPDLPVVADLLVADVPGPLVAAVDNAGGRAVAAKLREVTWWPGVSCTARWDVDVADGPLAGRQDLAATTKTGPDGALAVAAGGDRVVVWRVPHDPFLPGLVRALDPAVAAKVVRALGGSLVDPATRLRSYRATRRGVVEVTGTGNHLYLKVVSPGKASRLHRRHVELADHLPVPPSLGVDDDLGIVALVHLGPPTLRRVLEDPHADLPDPADLVRLATTFPSVDGARDRSSPIDRLPDLVGVLEAVMPVESRRLAWLLDTVGPDEVTERRGTHGDLHEAQLLVDRGRVVGVLDVDGAARGRPGDDLATLLGHLVVWGRLTRQPDRCRGLAAAVLGHADAILDPVDLRRRIAAVVAGLATGPFRVQSHDWPAETVARISLAVRWAESAQLVRGRSGAMRATARPAQDWFMPRPHDGPTAPDSAPHRPTRSTP